MPSLKYLPVSDCCVRIGRRFSEGFLPDGREPVPLEQQVENVGWFLMITLYLFEKVKSCTISSGNSHGPNVIVFTSDVIENAPFWGSVLCSTSILRISADSWLQILASSLYACCCSLFSTRSLLSSLSPHLGSAACSAPIDEEALSRATMPKISRSAVFSDNSSLRVDMAVAKYLLCYLTKQLLRL